jgi:hypothetical protein
LKAKRGLKGWGKNMVMGGTDDLRLQAALGPVFYHEGVKLESTYCHLLAIM